ncbi:hypothetical protein GCM10027446_28540 [Angustibacter peucedani]
MTGSGSRTLGVAAALVDDVHVPGDVRVADGRVVEVGLPPGRGGLAVPGFVDLQVNGYGGVDLLDADLDGWLEAGRALARAGVAAYVANLVTSPAKTTLRALEVAEQARTAPAPGAARLLGAALEGPYLSPERAGVHAPEHLRLPDVDGLAELVAGGPVVGLTLAPELPGALDLVSWAVERGLLVSLGHSASRAVEAHAAVDAGARTATHLFNAMTPLSARSPGLAAVALTRPEVHVQLICDGVHLADDTVRLALAAAGDRWVLVTDAMAAAGRGDGRYALGDSSVVVRDGVARDPDGTIAGSVGSMAGGVREAVRCGAAVADAVAAATTRPARLLGAAAAGLGRLRPGDPADVVVLDDALDVVRVLRDGVELDG